MIQITDKETEDWIELLEEGSEIIKTHTPISIDEKQPAIGQRCLVYEFLYRKEWVFAYWQRNGTFKVYKEGLCITVFAKYWLPEPNKPE